MTPRLSRLAPLLACLAAVAAACSVPGKPGRGAASSPPAQPASNIPVTVRVGYLPQLTQATAVVGFQNGYFAKESGGVTIQPVTFSSASQEVSALTSGSIDAAYIDPNSAVSAYESSNGGVKIISGATSGGSLLMTTYFAIKNPSALRGKTIATPGQGTDQDVALRTYLIDNGLNPGPGGNVHIVYESNPTIMQQFKAGAITGAWVDEQWATRMQIEEGATQFVDEATLWPNGSYATAVLAVRTAYLNAQPTAVDDLLLGQVYSNLVVSSQGSSTAIENDAAAAIQKLTGASLSQGESIDAWLHLTFSNDPIGSSVDTDATNAQKLGLIKSSNIAGIWDLGPLNSILQQVNQPTVKPG
jgi:NitT/TauT family transport system substrate-binding protein